MKKLAFVFGLALGFILGSKAGTAPYEGLVEKVRSVRQQPEVEDALQRATEAASDQVTEASQKLNEKLPPTKQVVV